MRSTRLFGFRVSGRNWYSEFEIDLDSESMICRNEDEDEEEQKVDWRTNLMTGNGCEGGFVGDAELFDTTRIRFRE